MRESEFSPLASPDLLLLFLSNVPPSSPGLIFCVDGELGRRELVIDWAALLWGGSKTRQAAHWSVRSSRSCSNAGNGGLVPEGGPGPSIAGRPGL